MSDTSPLVFPSYLYPAVAPLPLPMANHLLYQETQQYRRRPSQRPAPHLLIQTVLQRITQARLLVYEYLRPFVLADKKRQQRGESRTFPSNEWLLETLAQYTPNHHTNTEVTLEYWQKKGLLRREKRRGALDITSCAALFIARLAEEVHQKHWLPSSIEPEEAWWWCYGKEHPLAPLQSISLPLSSSLPASMILWTPWLGASWEDEWQSLEPHTLYRWAAHPSCEELLMWDEQLPRDIQQTQRHPLFGRPAVQSVLLQEARQMILARLVEKGMVHHEE